jgi:hypothetical protein
MPSPISAAKPLLEIFGSYPGMNQRPGKHGCSQEPFLATDTHEVASLLFSPELREGTGLGTCLFQPRESGKKFQREVPLTSMFYEDFIFQ